jgi:hypothetical protein
MTGRYPWGVGYYDMKGPEAIPLDFKLVADLLHDAGWVRGNPHRGPFRAPAGAPSLEIWTPPMQATHAIGKWNLGHHLFPYTPTRRGFDTFFVRPSSPPPPIFFPLLYHSGAAAAACCWCCPCCRGAAACRSLVIICPGAYASVICPSPAPVRC